MLGNQAGGLPRLATRLVMGVVVATLVLFTAVVWSAGVAGAAPGAQNERAQDGQAQGQPAPQDTTQPQAESKADDNETGANRDGPYDSTRDGSASQNGKGDGQANGKPCAGCVGKADNKNPPGQMPNGSDPNAGYECDRNQGVGKTNPAHTGCKAAPTPPATPTPTPTPTVPPGEETPPGEVPPGGNPPANAPPADEAAEGSTLPDTGVPALLLPLAAGLLAAGSSTLFLARRRGASTEG